MMSILLLSKCIKIETIKDLIVCEFHFKGPRIKRITAYSKTILNIKENGEYII